MQVRNLNKEVSGRLLFKDVSFDIGRDDKIGIVGVNGSGKTTLLNSIVEDINTSRKYTSISQDEFIGYFKQEAHFSDLSLTVEEYIKRELNILAIEKRLRELEENLDSDEKLEEYSKLLDKFLSMDGYNFDYQLNQVLNGFGLMDKKGYRLEQLSGGERSKVLLAKTLLEKPTLMFLDEPTNNLDLKSLQWLEKYLKELDSSLLIVSHDREFLDSIVNKIFELDHNKKTIIQYRGNYSSYKKQKEDEKRQVEENYIAAMEEKKRLSVGLRTRKAWADKGRRQTVKDNDKYTRGYERDRSKKVTSDNKEIQKQIEELEKTEKPVVEPKLELRFNLDEIKGNRDIFLEDVVVGYEGSFSTPAIKEFIEFGDRIRIVGDNAKGKTTLLKTILGEQEPLSGKIYKGNSVNIGYIPQDNIYLQSEDRKIEEIIQKYVSKDVSLGQIYTILNNFRIKYNDKSKKISDLSPGERTKLKLAEFQLQNINCLILDEVSNHLDIEAIESIEEALQDFEGTVIIVSHDRRFIDNLNIQKELNIETGKVKDINQVKNNVKKNDDFERI